MSQPANSNAQVLHQIETGFGGRWATLCQEIVDSQGPAKAALILGNLMQRINAVVTESFKQDNAPMRNLTEAEIDRRGQLCVDICLGHYIAGWTTMRIHHELLNLLLEELDAKDTPIRHKRRWGRDASPILIAS